MTDKDVICVNKIVVVNISKDMYNLLLKHLFENLSKKESNFCY